MVPRVLLSFLQPVKETIANSAIRMENAACFMGYAGFGSRYKISEDGARLCYKNLTCGNDTTFKYQKVMRYMEELIVFQTFEMEEDAKELAAMLLEEGINAEASSLPKRIDAVLIGSDFTNNYVVKIAAGDFERANEVIYGYQDQAMAIPADHPLREMSNEELMAVVGKPDEWGADNYKIALVLLEQRGAPVADAELEALQHKRIATLAEKKKLSGWLLAMGYLTALLPAARNIPNIAEGSSSISVWFFPGALGLLIGMSVIVARTTLPNGQRVLTYDAPSIKHGMWIVGVNVLSWVVNAVVVLFLVA